LIVAIVPIISNNESHLQGIRELLIGRELKSIYIFYDPMNELSESISNQLNEVLSRLFITQRIEVNFSDKISIIKGLAYVFEKEKESEIWIDIIEAPSQFLLEAIAFIILHGGKIYFSKKEGKLEVLPIEVKPLIEELSTGHKNILQELLKEGKIESISKLAEKIRKRDRKGEAMTKYFIKQLKKWGFLRISGTNRKVIELTEFGKGYTLGLIEAKRG
jgi:hypothetical protein